MVIAAQPTRGLDIGAAQFVHEQFLALRAKGRGLVIISEDLEELLALSGVLDSRDASVERLGLLMSGVKDAA